MIAAEDNWSRPNVTLIKGGVEIRSSYIYR
jgi:hypothetical protein